MISYVKYSFRTSACFSDVKKLLSTRKTAKQTSSFVTEPKHLTAEGLIRDMGRVDSCRPEIGLVWGSASQDCTHDEPCSRTQWNKNSCGPTEHHRPPQEWSGISACQARHGSDRGRPNQKCMEHGWCSECRQQSLLFTDTGILSSRWCEYRSNLLDQRWEC